MKFIVYFIADLNDGYQESPGRDCMGILSMIGWGMDCMLDQTKMGETVSMSAQLNYILVKQYAKNNNLPAKSCIKLHHYSLIYLIIIVLWAMLASWVGRNEVWWIMK